MLSDVFSAFLLDAWQGSNQVPAADAPFVALLAKRTPLQRLMQQRRIQQHPRTQTFLQALEQAHAGQLPAVTTLFSQAYKKVEALSASSPYVKVLWQKELSQFLTALGYAVAHEQFTGDQPSNTAFGTVTRRNLNLLGGSRIYANGQLVDTSWRGRVHAFTNRITL